MAQYCINTPENSPLEPKNHLIEKENHLPNLHFGVRNLNFPGCSVCRFQLVHDCVHQPSVKLPVMQVPWLTTAFELCHVP